MAEIIKKKQKIRDVLKNVVEKSFSEAEDIIQNEDDTMFETITSYYETLKRKIAAIKTIEDEIIDLSDDENLIEVILNESTTFEICTKARLNVLHKVVNKNVVANVKDKPTRHDTVKLPKLEILKFSGDPTTWQPFIDSFNAAVNNSRSLSNVEKFNYLRSFLTDDALHAISGLSLTNNNYEEAMELLKNRYGNNQIIVSAHMNALVKLQHVDDKLKSLRKFYDDVESHVRSLTTLGIDVKSYGTLVGTLILEKLPEDFRLIISRNMKENTWDLTKILELINLELRARETCVVPKMKDQGKNDFDSLPFTGSALFSRTQSFHSKPSDKHQGVSCVFCRGQHWSDKCDVITDSEARKDFLRKGKRCFLCLRPDHISRNCSKTKSCFYCKGMHNSAICNKNNRGKTFETKNISTNCATNFSSVFLQTADIILENPQSMKQVKVKVLLDQGSQRSYVTERVKTFLDLAPISQEKISIYTFGNKTSENSNLDKVLIHLKGLSNENFEIEALCRQFICSPIKNQPVNLAKTKFDFLKDLQLADSGSDDEIDLLIGSDFYWSIVTGKVRLGKVGEPVGLETRFGWVLNGPVTSEKTASANVNIVHETSSHVLFVNSQKSTEAENLENELHRFWDLETLGISENEKTIHEDFSETIYLNDENRYEAKLPFRENHPFLHDHFSLCEKRLKTLHSKLKNDTVLLKRYNDIFVEQRELGIIEETPDTGSPGFCHYIPHHPVIREDKNTSKIRIVFDASAKGVGPSLNDCLYKGPQLTPLIFDILTRFRTYAIALTSDIEKAFLQISIEKNDRDFLRFLWFDDVFSATPKIVRNRFARVIFGVTSSPFLLNQTIRKHTQNYEYDTEFIEKVLDSFYVDDFSGGENDFEKAFKLYKKLKLRFLQGLFYLRKWRTNHPELRKLMNENADENLKPSKILGVIWDETNDNLIYDFKEICEFSKTLKATKRNVLKILAMFYDPIGVLQPIIINLKVLFQELCKTKVDWDDDIPNKIKTEWENILLNLETIEKIVIPRKIIDQNLEDPLKLFELHGFSDASLQNYGACIYIRSVSQSGKVSVNLVATKSRLAPIKGTTIPRLELLGNLLLSRLMTSVKNALSKTISISDCYFWTDSQVTLSWIKAQKKEFKTFVENRVQEIRKNTKISNWFYCDTKNNPADLLTRKKSFENFQENNFWWFGSQFLSEEAILFKREGRTLDNRDRIYLEEFNTSVLFTKVEHENFNVQNVIDVNDHSSLLRLFRITAWVCRFIKNLRGKITKKVLLRKPFVTTAELRSAENLWIKENQKHFGEVKLRTLTKDLNLIYDENELIRCEGRLKNAPLPYEAKTPYLINSDHYLAELIVNHYHKSLKHISIKQTLTELRQKFWICRGRNFVRKILKKCISCRKFEGPHYQYPATPSLTKMRLNDSYAFVTTGIDNFGPLYVKPIFYSKTDNEAMYKVWVTLYTCAASRAIILDIVPHMDSHSFIKSFRRFVSRRGCPSNVISDGGKNFVSVETQEFVSRLGVEWKVNLPLAPWHGGFFERLVKSTKTLLKKELKNCRLNYEELQTVLFEVETILNNRPLTYYYNDNNETCLTPNNMLFGRNLKLFDPEQFEISYEPVNVNAASTKISNITNHFWERWRKEYLVNLRESQRITSVNRNLPSVCLKDIVLVEDEKLPRSMWRVGIVEELYKGKDDKVRGAAVRIPKTKSLLKRPVNRLYPIESIRESEVNKDNVNRDNINSKPRREAAVIGELKRRFLNELSTSLAVGSVKNS